MIELNFSNSKLNIDNMLIYDEKIEKNEMIKIDSTAVLFNDLNTKKDLVANYSLTSFGNISADGIMIHNDLVCYGDIKCNKLEVYGQLKCYGEIEVEEVHVIKDAIVDGGIVKQGNFKKNLIVMNTVEVIEHLIVDENIICNEGIFGEGYIKCKKVVVNDYLEIEVFGDKVDLEESTKSDSSFDFVRDLEMSKNTIEYVKSDGYREYIEKFGLLIKKIKDSIPMLEENFEYKEIREMLLELSKLNFDFKVDYILFKNILEISEIDHIEDIVLFLKIVDYRRKMSSYMIKISICDDMLNYFLDNERKKIDSMSADSIKNHSDFVKALYLLENNKAFFKKDEYLNILDKIYSRIGIRANMVKKFVELGE